MKPEFESKEYGIGGHNKLDVRVMGDDVQIWIKDGDINAIICMDREDLTKLGKTITKLAKVAPESIDEGRDYNRPTRKRKVKLSSDTVEPKKKRKTRSDKGKTRVKTQSFDEMKAEKMAKALA